MAETKVKDNMPKPPLDRYKNDMHPFICSKCGSTGTLRKLIFGPFTCDNPECDCKTYVKKESKWHQK